MGSPTISMGVAGLIGVIKTFSVVPMNKNKVKIMIKSIEQNDVLVSNTVDSMLDMMMKVYGMSPHIILGFIFNNQESIDRLKEDVKMNTAASKGTEM
jgi:hypothetical protein